jgi:hypothetical protein
MYLYVCVCVCVEPTIYIHIYVCVYNIYIVTIVISIRACVLFFSCVWDWVRHGRGLMSSLLSLSLSPSTSSSYILFVWCVLLLFLCLTAPLLNAIINSIFRERRRRRRQQCGKINKRRTQEQVYIAFFKGAAVAGEPIRG